jgi:hypothetical protein
MSLAPPASSQSPPLAGVARRSLDGDDAARAAAIANRLLAEAEYDGAFASELAAVARGAAHASWELRRVACLALESEFLRIDDAGDLAAFLRHLRLLTRGGKRVQRRVLEEGYTTTELAGFAAELRARLARFEWIHAALARREDGAAADFLAHARHECLLAFARYVFRPREVVREIVARVRRTRGIPKMPALNAYNLDEVRRALALLPRYEREIVERLTREPVIYWVADTTPSEINALVEYPLGTVALVVKPPGSDLEIEIKRAGTRGPRAVDCVLKKPGAAAPLTPLHHFYGGSFGRLLRWEAAQGATLMRLWRGAYGSEAPLSRIVHLARVIDVPGPRGDCSLVSYFGRADGYGEGYAQMREAMAAAVPRIDSVRLPSPPNDTAGLGLTGKWIAVTAPEQAVIVNTTSFRIDRLAAYLGPDGLAAYFELPPDGARRFADMLLSEVLAEYAPPPVEYRGWPDYLDAAFAVQRNRRAADAAYVDVLRQFGDYFGFLCAVRAGSGGESFVGRNVGLRRVFRGGAWRTQTIFMDHDAVVFIGRDYAYCDAEDFLDRAFFDLTHMAGGTVRYYTRGSIGALKAIYRVDAAVAAEGLRALKQAFRERYRAARRALESDETLQRFFRKDFVPALRDWDDVIRHFLAARRDNVPMASWRRRALRMLRKRGYDAKRAAGITQTMLNFELLLPWFGFLFEE